MGTSSVTFLGRHTIAMILVFLPPTYILCSKTKKKLQVFESDLISLKQNETNKHTTKQTALYNFTTYWEKQIY